MSNRPPVAGRFEVIELAPRGLGSAGLCVDAQADDAPVGLLLFGPAEVPSEIRAAIDAAAAGWASLPPLRQIVGAHEVVSGPAGELAIVVDYVAASRGRRAFPLTAVLGGAPLPFLVAWNAVAGVAAAMAALFAVRPGAVHGALRPASILAGWDLRHWVTDIGVGAVEVSLLVAGRHPKPADRETVAAARYVAPEQWRGEAVDGRADLYALGCIFHELLAGRPAVAGDTVGDIREAHVDGAAAAAPFPPELGELGAFVRRLVSRDPRERPSSWAEVVHALDRWRHAAGGADPGFLPQPIEDARCAAGWADVTVARHRLRSRDHRRAATHAARAFAAGQSTGDAALLFEAHLVTADVRVGLGRPGEAAGILEAAYSGSPFDRHVELLDRLGKAQELAGDAAAAVATYRKALSPLYEKLERDAGRRCDMMLALALLLRATKDLAGAADLLEALLRLAETTGDRKRTAAALGTLGQVRRDLGDVDGALGASDRALELFRALGDRRGEAMELHVRGHTLVRAGRKGEALRAFQAATDASAALGLTLDVGRSLFAIGQIALDLGNPDLAASIGAKAAVNYRKAGQPGLAHDADLLVAEARAKLPTAPPPSKTGRFFQGKQANGWATIEISPYDYSGDFLQDIVDRIREIGAGTACRIEYDGLDTYTAELVVGGATATAHMDNWGCAIAFSDEAVRDRILEQLVREG